MSNRYLTSLLRGYLRKAVEKARIVAEESARDAILRLGVADSKAPVYLKDEEKELRRRLRAHARALGDSFDKTDETQETKRLVEAAAYAHWHRMLFARFLAERGLLRNPEYDVPVSLEDCRELAEAEGLTDAWAIAERYAAAMLPAVFRIDDPVLALDLDPVHTQKLHRLVTGLDTEVFQAEDSLGWTYQFWRAAEKDAVNASGVKIGADELPAVTQLFTEPYMVRFLLHNTLGAWWAGKVLAADPALAQTAADEDALRAACALPDYSFDMLRFVREGEDGPWRPAAGTFQGWPKEAKAITMLDPCCGSGHFLTEALVILAAIRHVEEHLSSADTVTAVLRDNLHGLEIDGRCVQIAAFAVALTAWRIGGWQTLPLPHIAWVGAPPPLPMREFTALAEDDKELEYALAAFYDLFAQAPHLGSLLVPAGRDLFEAEKLQQMEKLLTPLLAKARRAEPELHEGIVAARGMADSAAMLRKKYCLQVTNVPFRASGTLTQPIKDYIEYHFELGKRNLGTAMLQRMLLLSDNEGVVASVTPREWLSAKSYEGLRAKFVNERLFDLINQLGAGAFQTISGEVVNVSLLVLSRSRSKKPRPQISIIDLSDMEDSYAKEVGSAQSIVEGVSYSAIEARPSYEVVSASSDHAPLSDFVRVSQGLATGDIERFSLKFWEVNEIHSDWEFWQGSTGETSDFNGCETIIRWGRGSGSLHKFNEENKKVRKNTHRRGLHLVGREGVLVTQMGGLCCSLFLGERFDDTTTCLSPINASDLAAIWCFVSEAEYSKEVRKFDTSIKVPAATLAKPSIDIERYRRVAAEKYPAGLPKPYSDQPHHWIFHGHPNIAKSGTVLHVALARLCGYCWPAETDPVMRLSDDARNWTAQAEQLPRGDNDGLFGVPPVAGEKTLADRLRAYLSATFGTDWSDALERRLIAEADKLLDKKTARDSSLEAWVRDRAFRQHCALFGQRPFLWHISDGLKDGFSVFVHYHRFDQANLRKLTYTLLGDWLRRANDENNALRYEKGRELQQMLEKVLEGEKPYDIFVRWKSLAQQPLGWDPDLDDGVRQNIRPFIKAGVLTHDLSKILKEKDRGNDVASAPWYPVFNGERRNDHHTTLAEKRAAREAAARHAEAAK